MNRYGPRATKACIVACLHLHRKGLGGSDPHTTLPPHHRGFPAAPAMVGSAALPHPHAPHARATHDRWGTFKAVFTLWFSSRAAYSGEREQMEGVGA